MSSGNLVDEGTFGTIVAMAILRKVQQAGAHCRQRGRLAVQPVRLGQRHRLHLGARPVIVAPQVQQLANLFDREAEVARIGNEPQQCDVIVRIIAITAVPTWRCQYPASAGASLTPSHATATIRPSSRSRRFTQSGSSHWANLSAPPALLPNMFC